MRSNRLVRTIAALLLAFCFVPVSFAQSRFESMDAFRAKPGTTRSFKAALNLPNSHSAKSLFKPALLREPLISSKHYIGAELGVTTSTLMGAKNWYYNYSYPYAEDPVNDPRIFELNINNPGIGFGFLLGGVLDFSLSDVIGLQGKVRYQMHNSSGTESMGEIDCIGEDGSPGRASISNNYSSTWQYIGANALLRVQFAPNSIYGLTGFEFGSLIGDSFTGFQRIDNSTNDCQYLFLPSQQRTGKTQLDLSTVGTGLYNSTRLAIDLGIGTFIPLDNGHVLTPELMLSFPVSELFTDDEINGVGGYKANNATAPQLLYATLTVAYKIPFGGYVPSEEEVRLRDVVTTQEERKQPENGIGADGKMSLKGTVKNQAGDALDANLTVVDLGTSEVVAQGRTDADGRYDLRVKAPGKYSVTADAEGYLFGSAYFEVDDAARILRRRADITLAPANGSTRLLVFFDFDKATLQPASYPELNRAVTLMKANKDMTVEIAGYTDSKGADDYNRDLSERRANTVRDYLIKGGVPKVRVTAKGYGESSPVADNETEEGRAENRRVEFVVTNR